MILPHDKNITRGCVLCFKSFHSPLFDKMYWWDGSVCGREYVVRGTGMEDWAQENTLKENK